MPLVLLAVSTANSLTGGVFIAVFGLMQACLIGIIVRREWSAALRRTSAEMFRASHHPSEPAERADQHRGRDYLEVLLFLIFFVPSELKTCRLHLSVKSGQPLPKYRLTCQRALTPNEPSRTLNNGALRGP